MTSIRTFRPISVNFHLWPKCNFTCRFCYAGFPAARTALPLAAAKRLIELLAEAGTEKITFVGGEPTLHPHLPALVRHAASLGLTTCIVTNGANLLKVLDEAPGAVHWVGLSVDSGVEAVQAEARTQQGRNGLVRVLAGLAHIDRHVGVAAAPQDGINLCRAQVARVPNRHDEVGEAGRGRSEAGVAPAPIGVRVREGEGADRRGLRGGQGLLHRLCVLLPNVRRLRVQVAEPARG